jgi:Animal haem peroxidase
MERHARDSYFIVGEGVVSADPSQLNVASGAAALAVEPAFRFSRIGPRSPVLAIGVRRKVATAMTEVNRPAGTIPAGFTYLGQFIDHDLTFDVTEVAFGETLTVDELEQARSPSLDLDSLYGRGPQRPGSRRFYEADRVRLKMGTTEAVPGGRGNVGIDLPDFDLPRVNEVGAPAVIPDKRNDENLAVAQTHLAMIRFHNRVVGRLEGQGVPTAELFARARALVVRHYQWMIKTDFLPRIVAPAIINDVFTNGRKIFEVGAPPASLPTMPIEFSVGAFRLGHSMVRDTYNWNRVFDNGAGNLSLLFDFSGTSGILGGGVRLPSNWVADFRRLYDFGEVPRPNLVVPATKFNRAMRLDTRLVSPLSFLPEGSFGGDEDTPLMQRNLAFRNLTRANMLRLATGQQMVAHLQSKGVNVTPLTQTQILTGQRGADLSTLTATERSTFASRTPLWFYVLREAETGQGRLRGVGGRIVAETFHRAMEGSVESIVRDSAWRPTLGPTSTTFRMVDLLLFAFRGRATLLNPLGN